MRLMMFLSVITVVLAGCAKEGTAPEAVESLTGSFTAELVEADFPEDFPVHKSFEGEWTLILEEDGFALDFAGPASMSGELEFREDELVFNEQAAPVGAWNCYEDGKRLSGDVPGTYSYVLEDGNLTLEVKEDDCPVRAAILTREWAEETE